MKYTECIGEIINDEDFLNTINKIGCEISGIKNYREKDKRNKLKAGNNIIISQLFNLKTYYLKKI